jgi:7-keto-8-aminopelargonate synthetase-like enzyme
VPEGTSRLRATVMATHTDAEIDRAVAAFAAARPGPASGVGSIPSP